MSRFKNFGFATATAVAVTLLGGSLAIADQVAPTPVATAIGVAAGSPATPDPSGSPALRVKPGRITNLTVVDNATTALTLSWLGPVDAGSEAITDYRVTYKFDDFGTWLTWKHVASDATAIQITDLPLARGITFAIRPVTANLSGNAVKIHVTTPTPIQLGTLSAQTSAEYSFLASSWNARKATGFGYYSGTDCANWASQALLRRGFVQTAKWHGRSSRLHGATTAWISSTHLHSYLLATGKVTLLTDAQRDQVAVGDIVQFDWWNTGSQEHTGVVTYIEQTPNGPKIYYASHTANGMWWSVDRSINVMYPGATVSYLHLAANA